MPEKFHYSLLFFMITGFALVTSCNTSSGKQDNDMRIIAEHYEAGEFSAAIREIKKLQSNTAEKATLKFSDSIADYIGRYLKEYPYESSDIITLLNEKGITAGPEDLVKWEEAHQLEFMLIDNKKQYFKSAIRNLLLLNDSLKEISGSTGLNDESLNTFCLTHTQDIIERAAVQPHGMPLMPQRFLLQYSTILPENTLPAGKNVSMWMPYPLRNHPRQQNAKLLSSHPGKPLISPNELAHQSVFLSQPTLTDQPAAFETIFEFTAFAQYFHPDSLKDIPFTRIPDTVLPFLPEREPHIIFSENIKELAEQLTTPDMTPYQMVRSFYYWINDNIPWASAVEYGLIRNIPEYTLKHSHGDCGMQTLLFITLCRYKGIPARWQSGWMLHPGNVNLHDWSEVWYHGVGWVPVDVSFKIQDSENPLVKEFYISGIDAYRMIVNTDYGQKLYPGKKFPRSEPWDFQRGEMEWENGNLYFDAWKRKMNVQYLPN